MNGAFFRSERMRQKYLKITDGDGRLIHILFEINRCDFDEQIIDFYIFRGLTGSKLYEFAQDHCNGSPAKVIAFAMKRIERRNVARPRVHGLNWR